MENRTVSQSIMDDIMAVVPIEVRKLAADEYNHLRFVDNQGVYAPIREYKLRLNTSASELACYISKNKNAWIEGG